MYLIPILIALGAFLVTGQPDNDGGAGILNYEPPEDLKRQFPFTLLGNDHDSSPVWFMELGKFDFRPVLGTGPEGFARLGKYFEFLMAKFFLSGGNSTSDLGAVAIADMDGYSLEKAADSNSVRFFLGLVRVFYGYAVGGKFKQIIFINTNPVFQNVFLLAKPLLGPYFEKMETLGTNPSKWKTRLLKFIPGDQLPPFLGGSNKDFKPVEVTG